MERGVLRMSDDADPAERRGVSPSRVVAVGLGAIGAVAVFVWTNHAIQMGRWWQVAVAMVVWGLHALVVMRLWRGK